MQTPLWSPAEGREIVEEIQAYCASPCHFDGFIELPPLTDGEISLACAELRPADPVRQYVPAYWFSILCRGVPVGRIDLRVGYCPGLYFGGNIGYSIQEEFQRHGYAVRACRLLRPLLRAHGMTHAFISNSTDNYASRRVCEKLGAHFVRTLRLPEDAELYRLGLRTINLFDWKLEEETKNGVCQG